MTRILLRFESPSEDLVGNLAAAAFTPDGSLWLGSDKGITVERLSLVEPYIFGKHQLFSMADFVELFNHDVVYADVFRLK